MALQIPTCNVSFRQCSNKVTFSVQSFLAHSVESQAGLPSCSGRHSQQQHPPFRCYRPKRSQRENLVCFGSARVYSAGEIVEVEELKGIRVIPRENERPMVEYLVQWKDGSPDTWYEKFATRRHPHKRLVAASWSVRIQHPMPYRYKVANKRLPLL